MIHTHRHTTYTGTGWSASKSSRHITHMNYTHTAQYVDGKQCKQCLRHSCILALPSPAAVATYTFDLHAHTHAHDFSTRHALQENQEHEHHHDYRHVWTDRDSGQLPRRYTQTHQRPLLRPVSGCTSVPPTSKLA